MVVSVNQQLFTKIIIDLVVQAGGAQDTILFGSAKAYVPFLGSITINNFKLKIKNTFRQIDANDITN